MIAAITFGLTAGLKPGSLGIYVIHQTLSRGYLAGFAASFAPFVSDGPIILLAFFILSSFEHTPQVLAVISMTGALYLMFLARKLFVAENLPQNASGTDSFLTAVKINLLNPVPYLFWMTAGGAYLIKGSIQQAALFVVCMLGSLALSKFALASTIKKLGDNFSDKHYSLLLKSLSIVLIGFAIKLAWDGLLLWQQL